MAKAHVIVYSRPGCHLCDEATEVIGSSGCEDSFVLEEINIESSRQLLLKYQFEIPVVTINGVEAFRYRVDAERFRELIIAAESVP